MENLKETKLFLGEEIIINTKYFDYFKNQLVCLIDLSLVINPLMCSNCETCYCKDCIEVWMRRNNTCPNKCPLDKAKIVPCTKALLLIHEGLKLKCEFGCEVNLKNYSEHMDKCSKKEVKCWVCSNRVSQTNINFKKKDYLERVHLLDKTKFIMKNYSIDLCNLKRYDEAINIINKVIEIDPMYETGYLFKGIIYKHMEKYEDSFNFILKALLIDCYNSQAKFEMTNLILNNGELINNYIKDAKIKVKTIKTLTLIII